jgi:predicted transcriptional regulator
MKDDVSELSVSRKFEEIFAQLNSEGRVNSISVRELLRWFNAQRRGRSIVEEIREALAEASLVTEPDFENAYIDGLVEFKIKPQTKVAQSKTQVEQDQELSTAKYQVRKLAAANQPILAVAPNATLSEAITKMMVYDFSQLPVMTTERDVKGMVSWASLGRRMAVDKNCTQVRECMDQPKLIPDTTSIFDAISDIVRYQYVLVQRADKKITGIVTTTDLSLEFQRMTEPFLVLGEIENFIRSILSRAKIEPSDLQKARSSDDKQRSILRVGQLNFGDYVRLLQTPEIWARLDLGIDQSVLVQRLEEVRKIRNEVMHFAEDPISPAEIDLLQTSRRFLRQLLVSK